MGQHSVPQHYLRGFEIPDEPGLIWTYDRTARTSKRLPIKSVAQAKDYYDEADEAALARYIEGPALDSLHALRRRERLDEDGRARMAVYIATLMMRVPRRRTKAVELLPEALESTVNKFRQQLEEWAASPDADPALVARRFSEVDAAEKKLAVEPPPQVVEQIRSPWPKTHYVELLYSMTWRIISSDSEQFVTSDNPSHFFGAYGLGSPETEVCLPLAPDVALHMSRQGDLGALLFVRGRRAGIKEINRRVATEAERFVFSSVPAPWLSKVCDKPKPYLSRSQW